MKYSICVRMLKCLYINRMNDKSSSLRYTSLTMVWANANTFYKSEMITKQENITIE